MKGEPTPDLIVNVPGKPRTQGSMSLWTASDGTERAKYAPETVAHRNLVVGSVASAWGSRVACESPVAVRLTFYYARPKSHFGTGRNAGIMKDSAPRWPATRNRDDIDKSSRLILDALVIGGALADDGQVVVLRAEKRYQDPGLAPFTLIEMYDLDREW